MNIGQIFRIAVEALIAMAAHAAAQPENFAALVEGIRHFCDDLFVVALLAARLDVFRMVHRPEPERMAAVRLDDAVGGDAVAAVTRRAAELLRIVNLQQFFVGMADEDFLTAHRRFGQSHRLARAQVAGLAAVHQVDIFNVNLADLDGKVVELFLNSGQRLGGGFGDLVAQELVALSAQLGSFLI